MLYDEDEVEEQADIAQAELWDVSVNAAPVVLKARIYQQLCQREDAASDIEQNLSYRPTMCALAFVIQPSLWNVFHECCQELDMAKYVDLPRD